MPRPTDPQLRERVLDAAAQLFHERGYGAVSMQDLAEALGVRKASLYHYAPAGKEQLFVAVMDRRLAAHGAELRAALGRAGPGLEQRLRAVAAWAIAHAPLGLLAMQQADLPAISPAWADHLMQTLYEEVWRKVRTIFEEGARAGTIRPGDADLRAGAFISMLDGLTYSGVHGRLAGSMEAGADELIAMMLRGLKPSSGEPNP